MGHWGRLGAFFFLAAWSVGACAQLNMSYGMTPPKSDAPAVNTSVVPGLPMSAASAAAASTGAAAPLATLANLSADYRIGPNDLMDVDVFGVPDLRRTVRVNSSGHVTLPLVGNVLLAGLTSQQAEVLIASRYAEKHLQNPEVSVFIREFTTQRITIEGAVARPGIYPVTGQVTLLRALALAGGGGQFADLSGVMVFRASGAKGERVAQTFDLEKIRSGEIPDPGILADDVIVVRRDPARAALRDSLFRDVIDSINPFSVFAPR
jgi:polysaccharide biosynthesis/export protein